MDRRTVEKSHFGGFGDEEDEDEDEEGVCIHSLFTRYVYLQLYLAGTEEK